MAGKKRQTAKASRGRADPGKPLWLDILDVFAKMAGALFLLAVALVGHSLQARLTGISLQSQREQAESQLRANMFSNLISPIAGSVKDGAQLKTDREELLVELLALNFHDNFELKPLMEDVDKKLADESRSPGNKSAQSDREALRSIARRVADRQIGSIQWQWASSMPERSRQSEEGESSDPACRIYILTFYEALPEDIGNAQERINKEQKEHGNKHVCTLARGLKADAPLFSPDQEYALHLAASKLDWQNQTIDFEVVAFPTAAENGTEASLTYRFTLTWFDLPLTDNTLLPDGNRFAINLQTVDPKEQQSPPEIAKDRAFHVRVIWFRKGYFTPRERPLNFQQVRELIGLKKQ